MKQYQPKFLLPDSVIKSLALKFDRTLDSIKSKVFKIKKKFTEDASSNNGIGLSPMTGFNKNMGLSNSFSNQNNNLFIQQQQQQQLLPQNNFNSQIYSHHDGGLNS